MNIKKITIDDIISAYYNKSYSFKLSNHPSYVNIFGIRSANRVSNKFDDAIGYFYFDINTKKVTYKVFDATTDPGAYYLNKPLRVEGTAILPEGQYIDVYSIGLHRGQYKALVQSKPIRVYRDNNKDEMIDIDITKLSSLGYYGINIHRASPWQKVIKVDKYSAGCQVIADPKDFNDLMSKCEQHKSIYGNKFTYTLFSEKDIFK